MADTRSGPRDDVDDRSEARPRARRNDLPRLVTVSVSAVLCVVGSMWGSGVFGGPSVPEAADGALRADSTLIAPGGPAFSIWGLIYFGLVAYAVWQWLPGQRRAARHRRVGWLVAASMILNAVWLLTVREDLLWFSVGVIVVLAIVLATALRSLRLARVTGLADQVITDGTLGVYLGWVTVATCANVAATLVDGGADAVGDASEWITVAVLAVAVLLAAVLALSTGGNLGIGLAVCWGLAWVGAERLDGEPASDLVGWAAVAAALLALVVTVVVRTRTSGDRLRVV
ncbi:TspO/MBR family protein [Nocardioides yefusunii]|uniref:TspO/MBR family protein n=1 Tax=Nocardioides yefusunii TaxID=2500546 RepID=A0ABW1QRN6_9ACTN|nr:TspO/MBR family protein [Nocardioides yefusunii]